MAAFKIPGLSQAFSSAGSSGTNMLIAAAAVAITGYVGYTYFFKSQVEPTAQAAAAQIEMLASTNLVSLEEQLVNAILTYAQNRDTVMNNVDRIRTAAATYRIKLEELVKERLGNRVNETQMKQQLAEMVKELSVTLEIPLRVGISPPNPGPWNFWNNHLQCTGGQRFSTCRNQCVNSFEPDPYWCTHPIPPPVIFPPPPVYRPPIYRPPIYRPRPRPKPRSRFPPIFRPRPRPRYIPRPRPRPRPIPIPSCRRNTLACALRYFGKCTNECRKPYSSSCIGCKCACHGQGGSILGNFSSNYQSNVARAYSTSGGGGCGIPSLHGYDCGIASKNIIEAQLKVARKHIDKAEDACRGRGLGDKIKCKVYTSIAKTWCKNAQNTFNSKCNRRRPPPPPVYYPPPPPPVYHQPPSYYPPVPMPQPDPYYPPPPPVYYPPPVVVSGSPYVSPVANTYPTDLTLNQVVRQSTTPIGVYAGMARARRARAMRARAYATRIRPRFSGLN